MVPLVLACHRTPRTALEHSTLVGYSILLVEQEPHVARNLQRTLEGAGAHVLEAPRVSDALEIIDAGELSAAVLDYTRSISGNHRVARRLATLGLPFVFCKVIGRKEAWPQAPVLNEPFSGADLIDVLRRMLQPAHVATKLEGHANVKA
jgi:CheY-like chemotaxis protein